MGRINMSRVILGGIVAGLVVNVGEFLLNGVFLADYYAEMGGRLGLPAMDTPVFVTYVILSLLLGTVAVWLYAAARPRFGPGPATALRIGIAVWFCSYVMAAAGSWGVGLMELRTALLSVAWGFVEIPLATVAGAWAYHEE
jgi:hypothetical protein